MGLCSRGPLVRVIRRGGDETLYGDVTPEVGVDIVESHVVGRRPLADHVLDPDMAFFASQERIVLANSGVIEPDRIESYVAVGGYTALETALTTMTPQQIVETVQRSGLRGRGGAGYPTGNKWALLAAAEADQKYVVANGDEVSGSFVSTRKDVRVTKTSGQVSGKSMVLSSSMVENKTGNLIRVRQQVSRTGNGIKAVFYAFDSKTQKYKPAGSINLKKR